jgi:hypothetical protein
VIQRATLTADPGNVAPIAVWTVRTEQLLGVVQPGRSAPLEVNYRQRLALRPYGVGGMVVSLAASLAADAGNARAIEVDGMDQLDAGESLPLAIAGELILSEA